MRKRIGEVLIEAGVISEEVLTAALDIGKRTPGKRLGRVLVAMGAADDVAIAKALSSQLRLPLVDLRDKRFPLEVTGLLPRNLIYRLRALPIEVTGDTVTVALADPLEKYALEEIRFATRMKVTLAVAPESEIVKAIEVNVPNIGSLKAGDTANAIHDKGVEFLEVSQPKEAIEDIQSLAAISQRPPLIRLVNAIFADAIEIGVSDVHIEPSTDSVVVRYRLDGILRVAMTVDAKLHPAIVSRIKILSNMDISERRKPQDGKAQVRFGEKTLDLRVSTIPTTHGESVTVRILDPNRTAMVLETLGFAQREYGLFINALKTPQGIILVTGPTGSGKSSTLYAGINILNEPTVKIITVEDPVEYHIDGVNQVQILPKAGITFASGLRAILRQDPDIVMVGEIRDKETATIAIQAAQTGHLVLSTLHTNDAPSAVVRLLDLGVEHFLITAGVICVVGQRLVRRICQSCKVEAVIDSYTISRLGSLIDPQNPPPFYKGKGCPLCRGSGFIGRVGIYECLPFTEKVTEMINPETSVKALKRAAFPEGYRPMFFDGFEKALKGLTAIDEVLRVTGGTTLTPEDVNMLDEEPSWLESTLPHISETFRESMKAQKTQ
ncbi:type II/IV secretion system protein [bacterium]|nr:MAG: type II/IV secretion system protein [bacterium]